MSSSQSDYLSFTRRADRFKAEAADLALPGISYLRIELLRVRPGMGDFIIKVASPVNAGVGKSNTIVTLRGGRRQTAGTGLLSTAKVIAREMSSRGDETADWKTVNVEHLAGMIAPYFKFFGANTSAETLQFSTEALS